MLNHAKDAIDHLNSLQSPSHVIAELRKRKAKMEERGLEQMRTWLRQIGHSVGDGLGTGLSYLTSRADA